jgi:hypothetical protein
MQDTELTYFEELELKGMLKGVLQGKRETLLRLLTAKFGPLPASVVHQIEAVTSTSELDTYLDRFVDANSLDDIGLGR